MPIRINLLAEAQAAEEIRRRDPAKRAIMMAVVLVIAVLVWSASLQVKLMTDNSKVNRLQTSYNNRTNEYFQIINNQRKLADVEAKLAALQKLATNRFLQADLLNALQRTTVEGIQLNRLRVDQSFAVTPEVKAKTVDEKFIPGKPGSSSEKIVLLLDARDVSPNPGNEVITQFKESIAQHPYFKTLNLTTNDILLKNLSQPQVDVESGKNMVLFSLECRYPERNH